MKIKLGVVEKHYYEGVREFEEIDLEKFPIIKQFMDVNPNCTDGTIGLPDRIKHFKEYYNLLK